MDGYLQPADAILVRDAGRKMEQKEELMRFHGSVGKQEKDWGESKEQGSMKEAAACFAADMLPNCYQSSSG